MNETSPKLPVHEWLVIAILAGGLIMFTGIAFFSNDTAVISKLEAPHYIVSQEIDVFVEGEVEHSGRHRLKRGSLVKDLLALAVPLSDADLSRIQYDKPLRKGQVVKVPSAFITIYVEGAVIASGAHKFPKGARLQDLIGTIQFPEEADISKLRRKRLLKHLEKIKVPSKT
jgi:hypothetical protein